MKLKKLIYMRRFTLKIKFIGDGCGLRNSPCFKKMQSMILQMLVT